VNAKPKEMPTISCDGCGATVSQAYCFDCNKEDVEAIDTPHDHAAGSVRDWLDRERLKIGTDITPEIARIFERCAEDLEVG